MITPALLVIPLVHFFGRKIENPPQSRLKSGGYRKRGAVARYRNPAPPRRADQPVLIGIAVMTVALLLTTELDTLWIILGSALISWSASGLGLVTRI